MEKPQNNRDKNILKIHLTSLSFRELKKTIFCDEKISHIDVVKIIADNFNTNKELNNIQYWILNQMILKRIESLRSSNIENIFITIKNPNKDLIKSFKDLLHEHKITYAHIEIYNP